MNRYTDTCLWNISARSRRRRTLHAIRPCRLMAAWRSAPANPGPCWVGSLARRTPPTGMRCLTVDSSWWIARRLGRQLGLRCGRHALVRPTARPTARQPPVGRPVSQWRRHQPTCRAWERWPHCRTGAGSPPPDERCRTRGRRLAASPGVSGEV